MSPVLARFAQTTSYVYAKNVDDEVGQICQGRLPVCIFCDVVLGPHYDFFVWWFPGHISIYSAWKMNMYNGMLQ